MEIGENVKKYRELRDYTLPDLAARAGVSKAFLWEIETGNSKRPGAELLYKIAEALGVTIAHLMGKGATGDDAREMIEPEINDGLRAFINERKRLGQALEPDEDITVEFIPIEEVFERMRSGAIQDGKTLAALGPLVPRAPVVIVYGVHDRREFQPVVILV